MREFRKQVIEETLAVLERGWYQSASGRRVELDRAAMEASARRGRLLELDSSAASRLDSPAPSRLDAIAEIPPAANAVVEVVEGDCLVQALALQAGGLNVACLNMASHQHPGGGYLTGAGAQEENLFRRSAYHAFIGEGVPWRPPEIRYPLPELGAVYSPDVPVFRGPESQRYPFLDAPRTMSFIAVAAYSRPPLAGDRLIPAIADKTRQKIRLIFQVGRAMGHDALVLSALGCGAFRNPPAHMAELFREVLDEGWRRAFRHISFAIFDDHNAPAGEGNLKPFRRVLGRS
jgi:uncharacterized protein (TIGR02452 family)